jgi:tripartite-type tricarboxylate transporter receptor subunit TctC
MAALGFPSGSGAQGFPSRSITIIVPYPPGGPVDALARLIAQEAAGDLNQPIVVENRPGGSGIIGVQAGRARNRMGMCSYSAPTRPTRPIRA